MDTWQLHLPKSAISDKLWLAFQEHGMISVRNGGGDYDSPGPVSPMALAYL